MNPKFKYYKVRSSRLAYYNRSKITRSPINAIGKLSVDLSLIAPFNIELKVCNMTGCRSVCGMYLQVTQEDITDLTLYARDAKKEAKAFT